MLCSWLYASLTLSLLVSAAPAVERSSLVRRQAPDSGPQTVTTVTTTQTAVGTIVQTCTVRLTPILTNDGKGAVREDKLCKIQVISNGNGGNNNNNNNNNNSNNNRQNATSTTTETSTTTTTLKSTAAATRSAVVTAPPPALTGTVAAPANIAVLGTDAPAATRAASGVSPTNVPANAGGDPSALAPNNVAVLGQSAVSAAADQSGTSAAAAQESTAAGFVIPGKKLQVLPIGLGVFAGISVIALIVVGLVTYERTKYRKTFRQRKLAETAAPMGYGGMAER